MASSWVGLRWRKQARTWRIRPAMVSVRRVRQVAERLGRTPAQVLLRWCQQRNLVVLPKSTHRERIVEDARIFDFTLSAALDALDMTGGTDCALEHTWW